MGHAWNGLESQCIYYQASDKKSLSAAISACAKKGARLVTHIQTNAHKEFVVQLADYVLYFLGEAVWTGITDARFKYEYLGQNFRVTMCGSNASLLHLVGAVPSCTASHQFYCGLEKGTFPLRESSGVVPTLEFHCLPEFEGAVITQDEPRLLHHVTKKKKNDAD